MPVLTALEAWVADAARRTRPDRIVWCDGSDREYEELVAQMLRTGEFVDMNERAYPNSYLHRSNPNDVARTEGLTYICTTRREDAGPNNNWMDPAEAKERVGGRWRRHYRCRPPVGRRSCRGLPEHWPGERPCC